jgi:hypothetical protein
MIIVLFGFLAFLWAQILSCIEGRKEEEEEED